MLAHVALKIGPLAGPSHIFHQFCRHSLIEGLQVPQRRCLRRIKYSVNNISAFVTSSKSLWPDLERAQQHSSAAPPGIDIHYVSSVLIFPCNENCSVKASSASKTSKIWFKTTPFTTEMIPNIEQVQLYTYSYDQGWPGATIPGMASWSWFEIIVLPGNPSWEPGDDELGLAWTSHHNRINSEPSNFSGYSGSGAIFDRQHELVKSLQPGNVLAVRVCAQYPDWSNEAARGALIVILTKVSALSKFLVPSSFIDECESCNTGHRHHRT
ncbi:hypothetical protein BJV78DRAFT_1129536 [Lactifluus subvellereus]|nr:hypothetical protein BJV78DRAFT_1129536 [Lactifluus subvellereus]